jgi:hypothetical protein
MKFNSDQREYFCNTIIRRFIETEPFMKFRHTLKLILTKK